MTFFKRNSLSLLTILLLSAFVYLFTKVVVYLLIAVIITLLGAPIMRFFSRIKIGKKKLPSGLGALFTLLSLYGVFSLFFLLFVPLIISQIKFLLTLDFSVTLHQMLEQLPGVKKFVLNFGSEEQIRQTISEYVAKFINVQNAKTIVNDIASVGLLLIAGVLCISFITFFLLKEERMVFKSVLLVTPKQYEAQMIDIMRTSKKMLSNYFTGLFIDVLLVTLLVGFGMYFLGIKNAFVIGVFAGIMNIIPYVGPLISLSFALTLGVTGCVEFNQMHLLGDVMTKIICVLMTVNLLDALLFQPFIFSNSVRAHPLEIFLIILMASTLGGVFGMVVAIPAYTLIRIVAKEFLTNFKFFRKISEKIPD